jgi:hypothetical protein
MFKKEKKEDIQYRFFVRPILKADLDYFKKSTYNSALGHTGAIKYVPMIAFLKQSAIKAPFPKISQAVLNSIQ